MSEGFFPVEKATKSPCEECGLSKQCVSPRFNYYGEGELKILFVDSHPDKVDDEEGSFGDSRSYQFIERELKRLSIDMKKDCYYTTAVNCRPYGGKTPLVGNINACRPRLHKLIARLKPKLVILMGEVPFKTLVGPRLSGRIKGTQWTSFIGEVIPDQEFGYNIAVMNDVAYLMTMRKWEDGSMSKPLYEREPASLLLWRKDLEKAIIHNKGFYKSNYSSDCVTFTKEEDAIDILKKALSWPKVAFDYETTGIKPHRKGHQIVCASISDGMYSYAFPFFNSKEFLDSWKALMTSSVKKICHNMQYENVWTHALCEYWVQSWYWDTMIAAHCIHNQKPTGLKFCTYVNFGDVGYDDTADKFLGATQAEVDQWGDNAINKLLPATEKGDLKMEDLLLYNALDSLYTFKLYEIQEQQLQGPQKEGFDFFLESSITLSKTYENGICVDSGMLEKNMTEFNSILDNLSKEILALPEVKQWDKEEPFNFNSTTQLSHLLFDILKIKPVSFTESGKPSVDKETLPKFDLDLTRKIVDYRETAKTRDFLEVYKIESINGLVHPSFRLNGVESFRSGSNSPNVQQCPKRNKEAKRLIRSAMIPRRGNRIIEWDNSSLEVRINACYSGDPMLRHYLENGLDFHKDSTKECFLLEEHEVKKEWRGMVKGLFVFAEFYGSYYKQVAKDLWEYAGTNELRAHLASKGVKKFGQFEELIKEAEDILWKKRFKVHAEWRKEQYAFYQKHGYINTYTGFKLQGPMGRNNTFNGCVQGSGYHILQWTMNKVQRQIERNCERSCLIAEIHDSMVADVHPSEEHLLDEWVYIYGTKKVVEHWPWITVPLVIDKERSEIDGSWADMTACGTLTGDVVL